MIRYRGVEIDRKRRTISHNGRIIYFLTRERVGFSLLCALLLSGPQTLLNLVDLVYDDRDDGGPLDAKGCIDVTLHRLKKKIACLDIIIMSDRPRTWCNMYWAEPI